MADGPWLGRMPGRRRQPRPVWRGGRSQATQAPIVFFDHRQVSQPHYAATPVSGCHGLDAVITARDTVPETWARHVVLIGMANR